jgi:hypothetical protein
MKTKLLGLALTAAVSTTVLAVENNFTPIFYTDNGAVILIDKDTIKKVPTSLGDKVKAVFGGNKPNVTVWQMINTNDPAVPFASVKSLQEVNCNTRQTNAITFTSYTGLNGTGSTIVSNNPAPNWQYAIPNTAGEALVNAVCTK